MARLKIGDTVLHPIYGAGTLVSVEKRGTDGTVGDYYVIELLQGKGRLLTPVDKLDELGIRKPVAKRERSKLAKVFSGRPRKLSEDYRKRRSLIDQRLRDGSFVEVGRVVRDLSWVESQGQATTGDRRLLQRAKGLLAKELAASDGVSEEEALGRIDAALERRLSASEAKSA
jgi:CarD family transcriptional regulator